jgi:hypothetical protein
MKLVDPIAQSFYVAPTSGYFVTSLDLFFYSKDPELPVTVQLRPMEYGLPTDSVYRHSEVVLRPEIISTSNNGTLATRVTFESPVFLKGDTFHCVCILSNSDQYLVHISRLTEMDLTSSSTSGVFVTKQPLSGSVFKSQNGSTWTPVQSDDLKFTLYRANFKASQGDINFYNPDLTEGNNQVANLISNPLEMNARKIKIGLGATILTSNLTFGNDITQLNASGSGNYVGYAGSATGTLGIVNAGIGYTPFSGSITYNNIALTSKTGSGRNATASITITNGSVASAGATITAGGNGYLIGDVLVPTQIGASNLGLNMQLSVQNIAGINELIVDNVQGDFEEALSAKTLTYVNNSGITSDIYFSSGIKAYPSSIVVNENGEHIKINHRNHGMHSNVNRVIINNASSDISPSKLTTAYSNNTTGNISIQDATNFSTFENIGVAITNPGYVKIGNEIIAYNGVSGNTLTGITRQIDQTLASSYSALTPVMKYEINGVSLRRINKTFTLSDSTENNSIGLDYYKVRVDFTNGGNITALPQGQTSRGVGSPLGRLYFKQTKSSGGENIKATQNIPFEIVRPIVDSTVLPGTSISSKIRTVSGTSISGSELSYIDSGFTEINLNSNNYLNSPRIIASKINETQNLTTLPGKKSFTLNMQLNTANSYISPTIDLQRVAISFTTNRVDNLITNFIIDDKVAKLTTDPSAFVYANVPIQLELPANSIKIYISAHVNIFNEIKCLYSVSNTIGDELVYYPFPGYTNLNSFNKPIDPSQNSGLSDSKLIKEDSLGFEGDSVKFKEYLFTVDNLPSFRYYSIKLVGTSINQAYPPRVKELRVIALAGAAV